MKNYSRCILLIGAIGLALMMFPASSLAASFQVPGTNTNLDVGGYVKLDIVYNDHSAGDDDQSNYAYAPGNVPLEPYDSGEKDQIIFNGRESRIWVKSSTPTNMGALKTHIEIDFDATDSNTDGNQIVSNSRPARVRHAYGVLGNVLMGRTWSLFMHFPSMPELNDFGGPTGVPFVRQGQVRVTFPMGDKTNLQLGLENSETFILGTWGAAVDDNKWPDVIVRFNTGGPWGTASAAAMARELRIENSTVDDSKWTLSSQLAGALNIGPNDTIGAQINYGNLGRYSSLATHFDGFIDSSNKIEEINQLAGIVQYQHKWTPTWRSTLAVGMTKADDPSGVPQTYNEKTLSVHANLLWSPVPNTRFGIEYIRGQRELYNGTEGTLNRVQFSAKYDF